MKHSLTRGDYLFASAILFALVVSVADCVIIQHLLSSGLIRANFDLVDDIRVYWILRSVALFGLVSLVQVIFYTDIILRTL